MERHKQSGSNPASALIHLIEIIRKNAIRLTGRVKPARIAILIGGLGMSSADAQRFFRNIHTILVKHHFEVRYFVYGAPGTDAASYSASDTFLYTLDQHRDNLRHEIGHWRSLLNDTSRFIVVAHSFGGFISSHWVNAADSQSTAIPQDLRLVLIASPIHAPVDAIYRDPQAGQLAEILSGFQAAGVATRARLDVLWTEKDFELWRDFTHYDHLSIPETPDREVHVDVPDELWEHEPERSYKNAHNYILLAQETMDYFEGLLTSEYAT